MVVVTKIKVVHTKGTSLTVSHAEPLDSIGTAEGVQFSQETVKGMEFINCRGETVYLGMCKEAEDVLGVPIKNMFDRLEMLEYSVEQKAKAVHDVDTATLWQRIQYAVTGDLLCLLK